MPTLMLSSNLARPRSSTNIKHGRKLTNTFGAANGLGCTVCKIQCLFPSIFATLFPAGFPQAKKTTPLVLTLATVSMTFCVNFSHPLLAWLFASCARTVRQVFKSSTPRSAHGVRRPPFFGGGLNVGSSRARAM